MPPKKKFRSIPRKKNKFKGNRYQKKTKKIETEQSRKEALPETSGDSSGDSSGDEEHVETEKAASFKNLPASVRKMKAESSDSSKERNDDELEHVNGFRFIDIAILAAVKEQLGWQMEKPLVEKDGLRIRELINCKFIMARQSGKIHMTLIVCKMLSWPFGITRNQQMKILIMISVLLVSNLGVDSKETFPREQQIMFTNHLFQKLWLMPFILLLKL